MLRTAEVLACVFLVVFVMATPLHLVWLVNLFLWHASPPEVHVSALFWFLSGWGVTACNLYKGYCYNHKG